jgi:chaperone required for assembly of F1-ATPase
MAQEWAGQGEEIDTAAFVLRDLADFAIDVVAPDPAPTVRELLPYAETDTLCYRAEPGEAVLTRQDAVWEPLLVRAEHRWDVRLERVGGIIHRSQPAETLATLQSVLDRLDPFSLAALKMLASLAASLVIGLEALERDADAAALWDAANLEEDWQAELWGADDEAQERRALRLAAFETAMRFAALARED